MKYRSTLNKVFEMQILPLNSLNTIVKYLTNSLSLLRSENTNRSHILLPTKQMPVIFLYLCRIKFKYLNGIY